MHVNSQDPKWCQSSLTLRPTEYLLTWMCVEFQIQWKLDCEFQEYFKAE